MRIERGGYSVWIDSDRLQPGEDWRCEIDDGIRRSRALIVVMTPTARRSPWVSYEWAFALGLGVKVIPLILKQTALHPRLETLQFLDFTNRSTRPWPQLMAVLEEISALFPARTPRRARGAGAAGARCV